MAFGEAYLTMQPASQKRRILAELARIVHPGGRIGVHEVAYAPALAAAEASISSELTSSLKVNVSPLAVHGWVGLLEDAGFEVRDRSTAPLHLLEPHRLVADEGVVGAARFVSRVLRQPSARRRVLAMRSAMSRNAAHLEACMVTATRRSDRR